MLHAATRHVYYACVNSGALLMECCIRDVEEEEAGVFTVGFVYSNEN